MYLLAPKSTYPLNLLIIVALIHEQNAQGLYNLVIPDIEQWPIYRLTKDRKPFIEELVSNSMAHVKELIGDNKQKIQEEIARALYLERIRMKTEHWRVDPPDERGFWRRVNDTIVQSSTQKDITATQPADDIDRIFQQIVSRYAHEIPGIFSPKTYKFASRVVTFGFARLLNTASGMFFRNTFRLGDRIKITGNIEKIRELALKGTLILTPTHSSNLDSLVMGWVIDAIGLPPFLYGAGLNLFNSRIFGFFMERLGAYKVDRRKKNLFYLETLKMFSRMVIERGCHSLFFPGGTRSRDGALESHLKLGLLGSAVEAQRLNFMRNTTETMAHDTSGAKKIFVVPLVLNYHFVLEAASLIEEYLKRSGKEKYYIDREEFPGTRLLATFLWKFFAAKSEVILSFGEPMDIFGHAIDEHGNSIDRHGNTIDISQYFVSKGIITKDRQRDEEYTRLLGNKITDCFKRYNTVLSSHLVAFAAFEILFRKHRRRLDLYGLLRLPDEDRIIPYTQFARVTELLRDHLRHMADEGKVQLASHMYGDINRLIKHGIANLGVYHTQQPLTYDPEGNITSQDMNLLYFYHNRLTSYDLEKLI